MEYTTNYNLKKPEYGDTADIQDINDNMEAIDDALTAIEGNAAGVQAGIAIVADGDTHVAISSGQYVYVKNNTHSLAEGLYVASAAISANAEIKSSNVTAAGGALNTIETEMATINADTGVSAGSYGPSSNQTPDYGATFNVPYVTVNSKGKLTAAVNRTVKIPASDAPIKSRYTSSDVVSSWGTSYTTGDDPDAIATTYGKVCYLRISFAPKSDYADWQKICTVNTAFRPNNGINIYALASNTSGDPVIKRVRLGGNGDVEIYARSTNAFIATFVYIIS